MNQRGRFDETDLKCLMLNSVDVCMYSTGFLLGPGRPRKPDGVHF